MHRKTPLVNHLVAQSCPTLCDCSTLGLLSFTIFQSLLKLMLLIPLWWNSTMMPFNHLILCWPLLLLPSVWMVCGVSPNGAPPPWPPARGKLGRKEVLPHTRPQWPWSKHGLALAARGWWILRDEQSTHTFESKCGQKSWHDGRIKSYQVHHRSFL